MLIRVLRERDSRFSFPIRYSWFPRVKLDFPASTNSVILFGFKRGAQQNRGIPTVECSSNRISAYCNTKSHCVCVCVCLSMCLCALSTYTADMSTEFHWGRPSRFSIEIINGKIIIPRNIPNYTGTINFNNKKSLIGINNAQKSILYAR